MNSVTQDRLSEFKSFFIGEPTEQSKVWIKSVREPNLCFSGAELNYQDGQWILDYGDTPAAGTEKKELSIENPGQEPLSIRAEGEEDLLKYKLRPGKRNSYVIFRGENLILETIFQGRGTEDRELSCPIRIIAKNKFGTEKSFPLLVRIKTLSHLPYALFDFNGRPDPGQHDFGTVSPLEKKGNLPTYRFSVKNLGTEIFELKAEHLSECLYMESSNSGECRNMSEFRVKPGRTLTFDITPKPCLRFIGISRGEIIWRTNDIRKKYESLKLVFQCRQETEEPYVTFETEERLEVASSQPSYLNISILNWGKTPAHVSVKNRDKRIKVTRGLLIPSAKEGIPGKVPLHVSIQPKAEASDRDGANLELNIMNSRQAPFKIPLEICSAGEKILSEMPDSGEPNSETGNGHENEAFAEGKACPVCSLLLDPNHGFCSLCGASVTESEPILKKHVVACPVCARKYKDNIRFCSKDGKALEPVGC